MFHRNPPYYPRSPHWIEKPDSVTVFTRNLTETRAALALISTVASYFTMAVVTDRPNAFKAMLVSMPKSVSLPIYIVMVGGLASLFLFAYSERLGVRFSRDAIEVRGFIRWRRFPRDAAENFKLYIKKLQTNEYVTNKPGNTKSPEFVHAVIMRFGLNRILVGGFRKRDKSLRFIEMCRLADQVSQLKHGTGAFEVVTARSAPVLPVEAIDNGDL